MKKGIIVLLITVLVAGIAFADSSLSGKVVTSFQAGLIEKVNATLSRPR